MTYALGSRAGVSLYSTEGPTWALDQTDLRNGVDATLGDGGGTFQKTQARGHQGVPTDMGVGGGGAPQRGVLWCLLEPSHIYGAE
jgi:hypothetical protein